MGTKYRYVVNILYFGNIPLYELEELQRGLIEVSMILKNNSENYERVATNAHDVFNDFLSDNLFESVQDAVGNALRLKSDLKIELLNY